MSRRACLIAACALAVPLVSVTGCGGGGDEIGPGSIGTEGDSSLGYPALATKNTTRILGSDSAQVAAAAALVAYPGNRGQRPPAVTLVDQNDWRGSVAAAVLLAPPARAPELLTDGADLGDPASKALVVLDPTGLELQKGAEIVRIGDAAKAGDRKTVHIGGSNAYALAAQIDAFSASLAGKPSESVVVTSGEDPKFAMPAAAWAAKSGDPVLFTKRESLPAATRKAIKRHDRPRIYVLGPRSVVSPRVKRQLRKLGPFKRISGRTPVANAIAFARYQDTGFGWGIVDPGHGLNFANAGRSLDAAAAAPLSATGTFGPLLLIERGDKLPKELRDYLLDIQPGYQSDPTRGVYNHGWLMGDTDAIGLGVQDQIDGLLEIQQVPQGGGSNQ